MLLFIPGAGKESRDAPATFVAGHFKLAPDIRNLQG